MGELRWLLVMVPVLMQGSGPCLAPAGLLLTAGCSGGQDEGEAGKGADGGAGDDAAAGTDSEPADCGNGVRDPGEQCDGDDLGSQSCSTVFPFSEGQLRCTAGCTFSLADCRYRDPCPDACTTLVTCLAACTERARVEFAASCAVWCGLERSRVALLAGGECRAALPEIFAHEEWLAEACGQPICGDRRVEGEETCDDGNTENGDGCSADCRWETLPECPDGYVSVDLDVMGRREEVYTTYHGHTEGAGQTQGSCGGAGGGEMVHRYTIPFAGDYQLGVAAEPGETDSCTHALYVRRTCSEDEQGCALCGEEPGSTALLELRGLAARQRIYVVVDSGLADPGRYVLALARRPGEGEPCNPRDRPACAEGLRCKRPEGRCQPVE